MSKAKDREYSRRWREKNPDYQKKWKANNPDYHKIWNKENSESRREWWIKYRYGVDKKEIPSTCEVCGVEGRICVDHDHETGQVRGFLCGPCNRALGLLKDNPETIRRLVKYLEKTDN